MKTLILLHGWGADGSVWQKQASVFKEQFQVETPTIPAWDPSWLAAYLQKYSLPDCLLVGWSLGGMLLLEALAQQPAPVGGLVLVGVAPVFCSQPDHPWGQPPAVVRAMRRGLKHDSRKVLQDFTGSCLSPGEEPWHQEIVALFTASNGIHLADGLDYLLHRDLRPLLPHLKAPCTIIQGDQDRIVDPEQARFLHDRLPISSLRLLPGAGHLPFWTQAEAFAAILQDLILGRR
ncbi:MAG: alpha/beta fold hydrolase [Thermodesulfobacteriota bacterium]